MNRLIGMVFRIGLLITLFVAGAVIAGCQPEKSTDVSTPPVVVKQFGSEPLTLVLKLDRERLNVTEQLTVELRAETGEDYAVKFDELKDFPGFTVESVKESGAELTGSGRIAVTKRYVLDPVAPGSGQVPVLIVDAWKKTESEATPVTVKTEPVTVSIESLLSKDDRGDSISDIAPPLDKPVSPWLWPGVALVVVLFFMACWYLWQRRKKRGIIPPLPLPAHLLAYQALDRLVKGNLLAQGQITAFYQSLSDIIRHYIEQRFGLRAPERTTEEFLVELGSVAVGPMSDPGHKRLLRDFLTHCDLVKFACHIPASSEAEEAVELCRRFIRETEPTPAETGGGAG
ncbi:MAG: hypothetical protein KKD63_08195 [Proteobacteria bacterium]|nr:protein BatD [Desulfobulbaceae bacterium]MBU4152845.1 hypothetical protein [Pseudomonadota bacterium]